MIERQRDESVEAYLSRVLLAICREHENELRVKLSTFEIDTAQMLTFDVDKASGDLIIRAMSRYGEAIRVQPRSASHVVPYEERARDLGLDRGARSRVLDDEALAKAEADRNLRRNIRSIAPPVTSPQG